MSKPRRLTKAETYALAERAPKVLALPPPSVPPDYPVTKLPMRSSVKRNRVAEGNFDALDIRAGVPVHVGGTGADGDFELADGYAYAGMGTRAGVSEGRRLLFGDMEDVDAAPGMSIGLFALLDATRYCAGLTLEERIILDCLADRGMTGKQVSEEIGISEATASRRVASIRKKAKAIRRRILPGHALHARDWPGRRPWGQLAVAERWTYEFRIAPPRGANGPMVGRTIPHPDWQRLEAERIEHDRDEAQRDLADAIRYEADPAAYVSELRAKVRRSRAGWRPIPDVPRPLRKAA